MKVLYVDPTGYTGLAYHDHSLCAALQSAGFEVTLLTCEDFPLWSLPRHFEAVPYYPRKASSKPGMAVRHIWATLGLVRYALRHKPDIIHFEVIRIPLIEVPIIRLLHRIGFPVLFHVHDVVPLERRALHLAGYRQAYRAAEHLTTYADTAKQELVAGFGLPEEKVSVLTHGHYCDYITSDRIDVPVARPIYGLDADHHVILFFGVLRESKGLDVLLEAMPEILRQDPQARLLVAGTPRTPAQLTAYKRQIKELRLEDVVVLRPSFVPDDEVERIFAVSDVIALPYRKGYYSGVIKLSYSHRKAVVASRIGGLIELLQDGKTGLFVQPEDPHDLANKLVMLLANPQLRQQLGEAGRRWAEEEFSWSKTAAQLSVVYERVRNDRA